MKLFRLQTSDWQGPWRGSHDLAKYFELKCTNRTHPVPWDDCLRDWCGDDFLFASPTMEILKEWFDPYADSTDSYDVWMREVDFKELKANGFQVYVLEVDEENYKIGFSKRQAAFRKDTARKLKVLPLESLFNTVASV